MNAQPNRSVMVSKMRILGSCYWLLSVAVFEHLPVNHDSVYNIAI